MDSSSFFHLIESMTSEIEVEILKCQGINNIPALLRSKDLYSIFNIDSEELYDLRKRACLKLNNGQYMIRPAIKDNLEYCMKVFRNELNEQQSQTDHFNEVVNTQPDSFVHTFVESLNGNMKRSKFRYQYNLKIRRFASVVYELGGRNLYQFLKLNLPTALPSIPTLDTYNNEFCGKIEEGEFRFADLKRYSNRINCPFVFVSEDCTGVISKICYDVETDSFIGFCPTLNNGLLIMRQYQTNDFFQLENWFQTIERSTLMNIYTVQHISNRAPPFLLSGFGTNNKIDAISVRHRWLFIYEQCHQDNIKILGFSSDADPKYLKAMRLVTG